MRVFEYLGNEKLTASILTAFLLAEPSEMVVVVPATGATCFSASSTIILPSAETHRMLRLCQQRHCSKSQTSSITSEIDREVLLWN